jgi:hypothetical protein
LSSAPASPAWSSRRDSPILSPTKVRVTLIDQSAAFFFGYSKLGVLFGRKAVADVLLPYDEIA